MKQVVLFTRPTHDVATSCLHHFSDNLIKEIKTMGEFTVIDLQDGDVTKENFEKAIAKVNPRLVILNGHGSKESICGHNNNIILDEKNINLLESRITYAVACDSCEHLGEIAIDKGLAEAYIGYEAQFMVVVDPSRSSTPSKDENLKVFIKPYAAMILSLISGFDVGRSIEETKKVLRDLIKLYGVYGIRDKYGDAPLIRFALFWDLNFLSGYGNMSATV